MSVGNEVKKQEAKMALGVAEHAVNNAVSEVAKDAVKVEKKAEEVIDGAVDKVKGLFHHDKKDKEKHGGLDELADKAKKKLSDAVDGVQDIAENVEKKISHKK